jgi:phosphatidylglycerol:prolipoprotein diacylglycerol transferase
MLGVIAACWLFARKHGIPSLHVYDVAALGCTPGLFLGRIANFINGELQGFALPKPEQANPPWWSVKFPQDMLEWPASRLAELQQVVGHIGIGAAEWAQSVQNMGQSNKPAQDFVMGAVHRLIEATQRQDQQVIEALRPLLDARYPSQLLQALTDGPLLALPLVLIWLKPRKPGVVGCWFLIIYGILRIATEHFRMPDAGVALLWGLSRGRVLSILMIVAGAGLLVWASRRAAPHIGGLLRGRQSPVAVSSAPPAP